MKKFLLFLSTGLIAFSGVSCSSPQNSSTVDETTVPQPVNSAIVDTREKKYGTAKTGGTKYYLNVMPNEESVVRVRWKVSEHAYNVCRHGDIATLYDNDFVVCTDPEDKGNEPSDNGGAE